FQCKLRLLMANCLSRPSHSTVIKNTIKKQTPTALGNSSRDGIVNNDVSKMPKIYVPACDRLSALKKIQASTVMLNVANIAKASLSEGMYFPAAMTFK